MPQHRPWTFFGLRVHHLASVVDTGDSEEWIAVGAAEVLANDFLEKDPDGSFNVTPERNRCGEPLQRDRHLAILPLDVAEWKKELAVPGDRKHVLIIT